MCCCSNLLQTTSSRPILGGLHHHYVRVWVFGTHTLEDSAGGEKFVIVGLSRNLGPFNTTRHDQFGEKDLDDFVALISGFAAHL